MQPTVAMVDVQTFASDGQTRHGQEEKFTVGRVLTSLTIINRANQIRAEDGRISPEQIRSVTLPDVLIDTGATLLARSGDCPIGAEFTQRSGCVHTDGHGQSPHFPGRQNGVVRARRHR